MKELIRVDAASRIPELVRRAFAVTTSGRPGPVLLDVPEDVAHAEHDFDPEELFIDPRTCVAPSIRTRPAVEDTESAARLLSSAKRPVLLVGGGIHLSQASEALVRLAEGLGMPVAHTLSGKGAIACTHKLSIGLFGRYSQIANDLIDSADCLLVVGCKLGEIATKRYTMLNPRVPIIHLDIVAEEIGRTASPEIAMWGMRAKACGTFWQPWKTMLPDCARSAPTTARKSRRARRAGAKRRRLVWTRQNGRSTWRAWSTTLTS